MKAAFRTDPAVEDARPPISGPRRVHQIINHFGLDRGGAERLARHLHLDLRALGVDARIVALEECPTDGMEGAFSLGLGSPYDPRAFLRLRAYAKANIGPRDVVHAHLFPASVHVAAARRSGAFRAPCMFTEHNSSNRRRDHPLGRLIDGWTYRPFDRIVAISGGVEDALLERRADVKGKTTVVLNGCDLAFQNCPARRPDDTLKIVSVGRLEPQKNYPAALDALDALATLGETPFEYNIVGEGSERGALKRRISELGLTDRVSLKGRSRDVPGQLRDADVFLMPSLWEGFGLAAVEAMNAGLPVVAADVPGLREVVGVSGECGLLVDPRDPDAIARALARLGVDPDLRAEMGRRGFERAARFDMATMTRNYLDAYASLTGDDRHGRA